MGWVLIARQEAWPLIARGTSVATCPQDGRRSLGSDRLPSCDGVLVVSCGNGLRSAVYVLQTRRAEERVAVPHSLATECQDVDKLAM